MRLTNQRVDRELEFKVLRDGHLPGYVVVKTSDWLDESGLPRNEAQVFTRLTPRPPVTPPKP
jgi:hypothetical protein